MKRYLSNSDSQSSYLHTYTRHMILQISPRPKPTDSTMQLLSDRSVV